MKTLQKIKTLSIVLVVLNLLGRCHSEAQAQPVGESTVTTIAQATNGYHTLDEKLVAFVKRAGEDDTLRALFTKHHLMMQYTVTGRGLTACIGFDGRKFVGLMGQPARPAELVFISDAKTLDRALRGEDVEMSVSVNLDLMRKLSLKCDLKKIRSALTRVYVSTSENLPTAAAAFIVKN